MDISIIIPAKNAEKYLDRCPKSLSEALTVARNVKSEVLVIDNGSDDKTLMLARKWREKASLGTVHIRYGAGPWQMIFRRKWWLEQKIAFYAKNLSNCAFLCEKIITIFDFACHT